jgi:hypothetical protein
MEDFFSRFDGATWPIQQRLHVYALPGEELRQVVAAYQAELGHNPVEQYGLGMQPLEFLHFTVQMLRKHRSEVSDAELDELVGHLTKQMRQVPPFSLRVGPPQASVHAVEMWVAPGADETWGELVECTRVAASTVFGADALPPLGPNATPHTSLGYGTGSGDSGALTSALKRTRQPLVEVAIDQVHLLAVSQHPRQGRFTWEPLAAIPLGQ